MEVPIADLIDQLCTVNMKIWALVERVEAKENTVEEAWKLQELIKLRSQLRNAINKRFGDRQEMKVYGSDKKDSDR